MHQLMKRLKDHAPHLHSEAAAILSSGTFPHVLFNSDANPAILSCMHASLSAKNQGNVYLSAAETDSSARKCLQTEINPQDIGQVWWLFDAPQPYLAEVFVGEDLPDSRLPHLERPAVKGCHVARMLGRTNQHVNVLRKKPAMCLFTPWCAHVIHCRPPVFTVVSSRAL